MKALDLTNVLYDFQLVADLKLVGLLNGIQSCSSMYSCTFCEGFKIDSDGKKTNKRGTWIRGDLRTLENIEVNHEKFIAGC